MLSPMQSKLLEMFTFLTDFLEKNGLRYYMIGGTMLGAVRHKGFIPWDDDIDIAMPMPDYQRAIDLLKTPVSHYVIESPSQKSKDFIYGFAKFYDTDTTMTEYAKKTVKRGVFIDIFPLSGLGNTYEEAVKNYKPIDRLNVLLAMKVCRVRKDRKWWKNLAVILGGLLPLNVKKLTRKIDEKVKEKPFDDYNFVANTVSTYRQKEIMSKDIFGTPKKYEFENITVYGPEKYDEYLKTLYNDWTKLPDEDKRKTAHDFLDIDLEKSYMEK